MGIFSCLRCLIKWTIILAIVAFLITTWLNSKKYLFTENTVAALARKYDSTKIPDGSKKYDVEKAFKLIHAEFLRKYPGHILEEKDLQWIFMNAGGWMGAMCLIHASLTEYVLFFGAAVETSGHSGRYWANITDTMLVGEFVQWQEGNLKARSFGPGETVYHPIGEVTEVNFKANTWMVEYGRGFIPSTLTFALADTFFSTTDFVTLFYILKVYAKALVLEAGYYLAHANEIFA